MNIQVGDQVVYVPKQNVGENIHHQAKIIGQSKNKRWRLELDGGKKVTCSVRRLLVGQVDAFQETGAV